MRLPLNLRILLLAFVSAGLIYDQATPIFEASDEAWHYGVVRELASGRGLPLQRVGELTTYRQEGSQPPLYHALGAALTFWVPDAEALRQSDYNPFAQVGVPGTYHNVNMVRHTQAEGFPYRGLPLAVHLLRWFSLLLGCGTVALTYLLAQAIFPGRPGLALLAGAFSAFNPMLVFISASVNNDNGIWLLSSLLIYVLVLAAKHGSDAEPTSERLLQPGALPWTLGVLLGLAILTKLSGLVLAPVVALFLLWRARREGNWIRFWSDGIIVAFCVLLLSGWWFYRNWVLYDELLGSRTMAQIYGFARSDPVSLPVLMLEWRGWWYSLWGVFGAFNVIPGKWVYALFTALVVLSIGGGVRVFWSRRGAVPPVPTEVRLAHGLSVLFIALTLVGNIYWSLRQHALQGRLALGAVAAMSTYLAAGVIILAGNSREQLIARFMAAALFIVSLMVAILYIAPRYRPLNPMMETDLPADIIMAGAVFDDEIELLGYSTTDEVHQPGETMQVTLYWRGRSQIDSDYNLALNVHGRGMENIAKLDTWPGGGLLPTGDWIPGAVYADTYLIPLSGNASAPTLLRLDVSFWGDLLDERLSVSANGFAIDSLMLHAGRLLPSVPVQEAAQIKNGSTFAPGVLLAGHTVSSQEDAETRFTVFWRAEQSLGTDWTFFVHMLNAAGEIVAQADGPPLNGDWPTTAWEPGHLVRDARRLAYGSTLPQGEYSVVVGLYDPVSGVRAAAVAPDGSEWTDWAVPLLTIRVGE
jgi:hypothetical protein